MRLFQKSLKYRNKPTIVDGIRFSSKAEAYRYNQLIIKVKQRSISYLELQPSFELQSSFDKDGIHYRAIKYIADFQYNENGKVVVEDVKGYRKDKVFLLKHKLFEYKYPELSLRIVK